VSPQFWFLCTIQPLMLSILSSQKNHISGTNCVQYNAFWHVILSFCFFSNPAGGLTIHSTSKSEFQIHSITGLPNCSSLFINHRIDPPILNAQGAGSKPLILAEPNPVTLPHLPPITHHRSFSCPDYPFANGGAISYIITKEVGKALIIFMIYNISPQLALCFMVPL
jgi:hypothetical protein